MALANRDFTYRDILKRSYAIVKKYKFLWFFGFFAAVLGTGGDFEVLFKNYTDLGRTSDNVFALQTFYQGGIFSTVFENIRIFLTSYPWQAFFFLIMIAVIFIVAIWLSIVSQIALFDAANKISKNKKFSYNTGYQVGNQYFGKVLLVNILVRVVLFALFSVIAAPLLSWFLLKESVLGGILFIILLFFFFIPISVIISFIVKYAIAYIVIKGHSTGQAIRAGWTLFKKNWLVSVEMALIMLVIGIIIGIIILIAIGLASVPFVLIGVFALFFGASTGSVTGFAVAMVLGMISWFVIVAILGSAYVAFQYTTWTLLFLELVGDKAESKLKRLFGKLAPRGV